MSCWLRWAKIFASEMALKVTTDALQLFGARGYSRNLPLERIARDARMFTIGGGTAQTCGRWRPAVCSTANCRKPATAYSHLGHNQKPIEPPRHAAE